MDFDEIRQKKVLLSGASGTLGSAIAMALRLDGATVVRLVRGVRRDSQGVTGPNSTELTWNPPSEPLDPNSLNAVGSLNAAIHLSGANVSAQRWTNAYRKVMTDSRVGTTRVLAEALARMKDPPPVLVTASAVGFYGNRGDQLLDESCAAGEGFFPELCTAWEAAARPARDAGIRVVHLRFGVVIGRDGGIVARLAPLFRLGLGGKLGSGQQWMSWVSESDAVAAALFAIDTPSLYGSVNVTSPEPVTNSEFTTELAKAMHCATFLPAPAFALRLAFGQMADEALLASTRAIPRRLIAAGFDFKHPSLDDALARAVESS